MNQTMIQSTELPETLQQRGSNLNQTQIQPPSNSDDFEFNPARESEWLDKFNQQQDKINNLKYKVSMLQQELRTERDQNEQTIENFTVLCQDLKFKGMDEVEDLQSDISILKDQLKSLAHDKAYSEVKIFQQTDTLRFLEEDNEELRQHVRDLKCQVISNEIDKEMQLINCTAKHSEEQSSQVA